MPKMLPTPTHSFLRSFRERFLSIFCGSASTFSRHFLFHMHFWEQSIVSALRTRSSRWGIYSAFRVPVSAKVTVKSLNPTTTFILRKVPSAHHFISFYPQGIYSAFRVPVSAKATVKSLNPTKQKPLSYQDKHPVYFISGRRGEQARNDGGVVNHPLKCPMQQGGGAWKSERIMDPNLIHSYGLLNNRK